MSLLLSSPSELPVAELSLEPQAANAGASLTNLRVSSNNTAGYAANDALANRDTSVMHALENFLPPDKAIDDLLLRAAKAEAMSRLSPEEKREAEREIAERERFEGLFRSGAAIAIRPGQLEPGPRERLLIAEAEKIIEQAKKEEIDKLSEPELRELLKALDTPGIQPAEQFLEEKLRSRFGIQEAEVAISRRAEPWYPRGTPNDPPRFPEPSYPSAPTFPPREREILSERKELAVDPVRKRAEEIILSGMSPEQRTALENELQSPKKVSFPDLKPEIGPLEKRFQEEVAKIIKEAEYAVINELSPEELKRLAFDKQRPGEQDSEKDFSRRVLKKLEPSQSPPEEEPEIDPNHPFARYLKGNDPTRIRLEPGEDPIVRLERELEILRRTNPHDITTRGNLRKDLAELFELAIERNKELMKEQPEHMRTLKESEEKMKANLEQIKLIEAQSRAMEEQRKLLSRLRPEAQEAILQEIDRLFQQTQKIFKEFTKSMQTCEGQLEQVISNCDL